MQMWLLCTMPNIQPIIVNNNMLMIIALVFCTCDRLLQNYYNVLMVCLLIVCFVVHIIVCPVEVIAKQSLLLYLQFNSTLNKHLFSLLSLNDNKIHSEW